MASHPSRLRAVDWLRGGATLAMVQCHALCLLRPDLRQGPAFPVLAWLDGFIAPAFFFAAGFSLAWVQVRAGGDGRRAGRSALRVGQVLATQVLLTSLWWNVLQEPRWLARIDVLSCIGLSLAFLLLPVTALAARPRLLAPLAFTAAVTWLFLTPALAHLSGPVASALLSTTSGSVFPLAPWGAHLLLGVAVGTVAATQPQELERRLYRVAAAALGLTLLARLVDDALPEHDAFSQPWAHLERWVEVTGVLAILLRIERTADRSGLLLSGIERLSRCSLSAYALHEVWLYTPRLGFCFNDHFGDRLSWGAYAAAVAALVALTSAACWLIETIDGALTSKGRLREGVRMPA